MTLSEAEFLTSALEAIEAVKTEQELLAWDDFYSSQPEYTQIPENAIRRLEDGYARKLREITGWGAE